MRGEGDGSVRGVVHRHTCRKKLTNQLKYEDRLSTHNVTVHIM